MQLNPESKKISEIFPVGNDIIYNIPIYQRNYSWRSDNVETLFQDIVKEDRGYYIGNLLVTPTVDKNTESGIKDNCLDVVDGQQRLTTISLYLLGIFYHFLIARDFENIKLEDVEVRKSFRNALSDIPRRLINEETGDTRLSLNPSDQEVYDNLMEIIRKETIEYTESRNRKMGKRFYEILELIKSEFLTDEDKDDSIYGESNISNLLKFYNDLNHMEILRINVSNLTDAFTIFTSFNAKGLPLTLIDLLKSYYLEQAVNDLNDNEALNKWEILLNFFNDSNNEPKSNLVTQFLQNNFDTYEVKNEKSTSSITKTQALSEYKNLFDKNGESYIDVLTSRALIFSSFTNSIGEYNDQLNYSEKMIKSLEKISKMEATSVYPVLIYTLNEFKKGHIVLIEMEDILDYLIKYFVRRNITLRPKASNLRAKALSAVRQMQKGTDIENSHLSIIKNNIKSLAADDDVFTASLRNNIYDINKDTTRIILVDLEREFGHYFNKQRPDNLNDKYENKNQYRWTLEHIMPQKIKENSSWETNLYETYGDMKDQVYLDHIHKLGNLTLTGYNSELSNHDFVEKRDYTDPTTGTFEGLRTPLFLNETIPNRLNGEVIGNKTSWTIDDINRRNEELIDYVMHIYKLD